MHSTMCGISCGPRVIDHGCLCCCSNSLGASVARAAAAAGSLVPVMWANSTVAPAEDLNCTAAANGTTTAADCECARLAAFFTEAEAATFEYVRSAIVQRLDPKRTTTMTANATQQACRPFSSAHGALSLVLCLLDA